VILLPPMENLDGLAFASSFFSSTASGASPPS
jgi:hypothetical protein